MRCSAFGLDITSAVALPGSWRCDGSGAPPLAIEPATREAVDAAWSGAAAPGWSGRADGLELVVEHGEAGDLLMLAGASLAMHLSPAGDRLAVAGTDGDPVAAARILLDSALFTVSLLTGQESLHAGAVATERGVLALAGDTGAGKSSLVAALLAEGCSFFTDDVLVLRRTPAGIAARPGPPVLTAPSPVPRGVGTPIADLGGETWLAVEGAEADLPLAGIVRLDGAGRDVPQWSWLLARLLRFPRTPERERARFELAADLSAYVPVHAVAARSASPSVLAASVLGWLREQPRN